MLCLNSHFADTSKLVIYLEKINAMNHYIIIPFVMGAVGDTVVALVAEAFVGDVTETLIREK